MSGRAPERLTAEEVKGGKCGPTRPGAIVNGRRTRQEVNQEALDFFEVTGDISKVLTILTIRERAFCREYMVDRNGAQAARRAGYAGGKNDANYKRTAHHVSRRPLVRAYIDFLQREKVGSSVAYDSDYVLSRIAEIINKEGAKDSDKLRGLELLAKHLGMFIDRTELTGKDGGALEIENKKAEQTAEEFTRNILALSKKTPQLKAVK